MIAATLAVNDTNPFALVDGLPVHPLVVHAAVVFVPLAALGLVLMALIPAFAARLGWLVSLTALAGAGFSFIAKESGEQLENLVGEPGFDHADYGERMPVVATVLFVVTVAVWLVQRARARRGGGLGVLTFVLAVIALLVAGASAYAMFLTGDSGARSVWQGEIASASAPAAMPTPSATSDDDEGKDDDSASPPPTSTAAADTAYTPAQVAQHNTSGDCWTSINGKVYDVTAWEDQHPGGAQRILQLCGIDGSSLFDDQHGGQPRPETVLADYQIGVLAQG